MNTYSEDKMYEKYSNEVERMQKCIDELLQENIQLKKQIKEYQKALDETMSEKIDVEDNWNKLKEFVLKKQAVLFNTEYTCYSNILNKMRELEQGSDSNE